MPRSAAARHRRKDKKQQDPRWIRGGWSCVSAISSSAMYFGQAVGTAAGAAVLAGVAGPFAYSALALISIPLFVVSIAVSLLADRKTSAA